MAGQHIYSSSKFIQSGSTAQFTSSLEVAENLNVDGTIFATSYKYLDGSDLITTGDTSTVFFAGSGSGISASNPFSQDSFFTISGINQYTPEGELKAVLNPGLIKIKTTGSANFKPTYFNFLKIGDDNEDLITVQQGGLDKSTYIVGDPNDISTQLDERRAGVHRYIIYAAETGSGGKTHQVFHTVTLDGYLNENPTLVPTIASQTKTIPHDQNSVSFRINHTDSFDPNILDGGNDDGLMKIIFTDNNQLFTFSNSEASSDSNLSVTAEELTDSRLFTIESSTFPGIPSEKLFVDVVFTKDVLDSAITTTVNTELQDNYPNDPDFPGTDTHDTTLTINPQSKTSIENVSLYYLEENRTIFYGKNTIDLNIGASADINYTQCGSEGTNPLHQTKIKFYFNLEANNSPSQGMNNNIAPIFTSQFFKTFIFSAPFVTASQFTSDDSFTTNIQDIPSIDGVEYVQHQFTINNTDFLNDRTASLHIGNITLPNNSKDGILHGTFNHITHTSNFTPRRIDILKTPKIQISDIVLEVEDGFGNDVPTNSFSTSLLTGLNTTLTSNQTESLIEIPFEGDATTEQNYVKQSIVRVRARARVIEPYDGHPNVSFHGDLNFQINSTDENGNVINHQTYLVNTESIGINNPIRTTGLHPDQLDKACLKYDYISPYTEVVIGAGVHTFDVNITEQNPSELQVGLNESEHTTAEVVMAESPPQIVSNIVVEVESGSFGTNIGHPNLTSSLLYGLSSSITSNETESLIQNTINDFINHPHYNDYIAQAIIRLRIKAKVTSPFIFGDNPDPDVVAKFNVLGLDTGEANVPVTITKDASTSQDILAAPNNNSVNDFLDLSNDFFLAGVTKVKVETIKVRGDLNDGFGIDNLIIGGHDFGAEFGTITANQYTNTYNSTGTEDPNQLVNILPNGLVAISFDVGAGVGQPTGGTPLSNGNLYEIEITFEATPIAASSQFESPEFIFNKNNNEFYETAPSFEGLLLVGNYTSPFQEFNFPTGSFIFTPTITVGANAPNTTIDTPNAQTASVSMSVTPPTEITDVIHEIETFGYSDQGTTTSTRTVLYGDAHETRADSSSFEGHSNAVSYASQSVTRFRVKGKLKEPFGPGNSSPNFRLKKIKNLSGVLTTNTFGSTITINPLIV